MPVEIRRGAVGRVVSTTGPQKRRHLGASPAQPLLGDPGSPLWSARIGVWPEGESGLREGDGSAVSGESRSGCLGENLGVAGEDELGHTEGQR